MNEFDEFSTPRRCASCTHIATGAFNNTPYCSMHLERAIAEADKAEMDEVTLIEKRLNDLLQGGRFIAQYQACDEDGSVCPTGELGFIYENVQDDESPYVIAATFSEPEDAQRFELLIGDIQTLLNVIKRLAK